VGQCFSIVKLEEHNVPILNNVVFAFKPVLSRFLDFCLCAVMKNIVAGVNFRLYKAFFKVGVNNAGGFRGGVACVDCPCAAFVFPACKKCAQPE
jgi:hypothetical protein